MPDNSVVDKDGNIVGYVDENGNVYRVAEEKSVPTVRAGKSFMTKMAKPSVMLMKTARSLNFQKTISRKSSEKSVPAGVWLTIRMAMLSGMSIKTEQSEISKATPLAKWIKTAILSAKTGK